MAHGVKGKQEGISSDISWSWASKFFVWGIMISQQCGY